jgi:hypothetical protein
MLLTSFAIDDFPLRFVARSFRSGTVSKCYGGGPDFRKISPDHLFSEHREFESGDVSGFRYAYYCDFL